MYTYIETYCCFYNIHSFFNFIPNCYYINPTSHQYIVGTFKDDFYCLRK